MLYPFKRMNLRIESIKGLLLCGINFPQMLYKKTVYMQIMRLANNFATLLCSLLSIHQLNKLAKTELYRETEKC